MSILQLKTVSVDNVYSHGGERSFDVQLNFQKNVDPR